MSRWYGPADVSSGRACPDGGQRQPPSEPTEPGVRWGVRLRGVAGFLAVVVLLMLIVANALGVPWDSASRDIPLLIALISALLGVDLMGARKQDIARSLMRLLAAIAEPDAERRPRERERKRHDRPPQTNESETRQRPAARHAPHDDHDGPLDGQRYRGR